MSNYGKKKKKNGTLHFTAVQIDNHYIEVNSSFEDVFKQKNVTERDCGAEMGSGEGLGSALICVPFVWQPIHRS